MLFIIITITFSFIGFIAFFGDYKTKELEKDKEKWNEIMGNKYY